LHKHRGSIAPASRKGYWVCIRLDGGGKASDPGFLIIPPQRAKIVLTGFHLENDLPA